MQVIPLTKNRSVIGICDYDEKRNYSFSILKDFGHSEGYTSILEISVNEKEIVFKGYYFHHSEIIRYWNAICDLISTEWFYCDSENVDNCFKIENLYNLKSDIRNVSVFKPFEGQTIVNEYTFDRERSGLNDYYKYNGLRDFKVSFKF